MSVLYAILLLAGLSYGLWYMGGEATLSALVAGGEQTIDLCLKMAGGLLFWTGVLELCEKSGVAKAMARLLSPLVRFCCPHAPQAWEPLSLNLAANVLGLSGAATPFALEAMAAMERTNPYPGRATDDMCALLILNAGCLKLLPTGQMALRQAAGSAAPGAILLPVAGATAVSTLCALLLIPSFRAS